MLERNTADTTELHVADVYFPMRRITVITDKSIIANNRQQWKQAHTGTRHPTAKKMHPQELPLSLLYLQ